MIRISRLSNPVRRIAQGYRAFLGAAILALGLGCGISAEAGGTAGPEVCVLVPHFKDEYWLSVAFGVTHEAEALGITPRFREAGGYRAVARQIEQIGACQAQGAAAILIGVVSADDKALLQALAAAGRQLPVIGFVNESQAGGLAGFAGVDWRDMGRAIGRYLADRHPPGSRPVTAVLITGPEQAGWTAPLETGLRAALAPSALRLRGTFHADTGVREQLGQVEAALQEFSGTDYLIGSAPAIEAAMGLAATGTVTEMPALLATYASHTVLRGLSNGQVQAVVFDDPMAQGRMAIRQVAAILEGSGTEEVTPPRIELLQRPLSRARFLNLSPPDFFPKSD